MSDEKTEKGDPETDDRMTSCRGAAADEPECGCIRSFVFARAKRPAPDIAPDKSGCMIFGED